MPKKILYLVEVRTFASDDNRTSIKDRCHTRAIKSNLRPFTLDHHRGCFVEKHYVSSKVITEQSRDNF